VFPTDDHIALICIVPVSLETRTLELEFDANALPALADKAPANAIREAGLDLFHIHVEIMSDFPEEEYHALLIERSIDETSKIDQVSHNRTFCHW
jgi:hypothetical protein